jgi:hypothetical protein
MDNMFSSFNENGFMYFPLPIFDEIGNEIGFEFNFLKIYGINEDAGLLSSSFYTLPLTGELYSSLTDIDNPDMYALILSNIPVETNQKDYLPCPAILTYNENIESRFLFEIENSEHDEVNGKYWLAGRSDELTCFSNGKYTVFWNKNNGLTYISKSYNSEKLYEIKCFLAYPYNNFNIPGMILNPIKNSLRSKYTNLIFNISDSCPFKDFEYSTICTYTVSGLTGIYSFANGDYWKISTVNKEINPNFDIVNHDVYSNGYAYLVYSNLKSLKGWVLTYDLSAEPKLDTDVLIDYLRHSLAIPAVGGWKKCKVSFFNKTISSNTSIKINGALNPIDINGTYTHVGNFSVDGTYVIDSNGKYLLIEEKYICIPNIDGTYSTIYDFVTNTWINNYGSGLLTIDSGHFGG